MQEIVDSVRRVTDIMTEIAQASHEQTNGIEQINRVIAQMDASTQQNAELVEESAAAAAAMHDQAVTLSHTVARFKLQGNAYGAGHLIDIGGSGYGTARVPLAAASSAPRLEHS